MWNNAPHHHHNAVLGAQEEQPERGPPAPKATILPPSSGVAPPDGNGEYAREIAESLRFQEEIQSLMREGLLEPPTMVPSTVIPPAPSSSSFTALLGLLPKQAVELLHDAAGPTTCCAPLPPPLIAADFPFPAISPSNATLVERAAGYSVFATTNEGSTDSTLHPSSSAGYCDGSGSSRAVKPEPADSGSRSDQMQQQPPSPSPPRAGKRKDLEKTKGKSGGGKKMKNGADDAAVLEKAAATEVEDKNQLPYVHVRARRGQATDSHSLAERARREKINARMKLLQELVPGCNKISGTALVLDEIINHVRCLQRQVELLSMRLAAVNPRIDFSCLDSFLASEPVRVPGSAVVMDAAAAAAAPAMWAEVPVDGVLGRHHNQIWQEDSGGSQLQPSPSLWRGDSANQQQQLFMHHHHHALICPATSLFGYDSANTVSLHASQLKTEL